MTADENHPQSVIRDFVVGKNRRFGCEAVALHQARDLGFFRAEGLLAPNYIQREVARCTHDPRRRIFRNAAVRPALQRPRECLLHDVLSEIQMLNPKDPG
jgi:hypothetical protein